MNPPSDRRERESALDPTRSFIVQAPAGSGKTELLIQRFLTLLSRVERPEAVVAITFTRKAAGEMRERVIHALAEARSTPEPREPHKAETWRMAQRVLDHDRACGWQLEAHPSRLQIFTIDALCLSIARRMPVTSGFGAQPAIVEDAEELYRDAARETLLACERGGAVADGMTVLLDHLDNDWRHAEDLLTEMLPRRDQWMRHLSGASEANLDAVRRELEANIADIVTARLEEIRDILPADIEFELMECARFAATNADGFAELADQHGYPPPTPDALPLWRCLRRLLLTDAGKPRSRYTVNEGFPPGCKRQKQAISDLAARITPELTAHLHTIAVLPEARYTDEQWAVLRALLEVLPAAAAQLRETFRKRRQVDFPEISRAAIAALGVDNAPTQLAYVLDCRIEHILVDEFQDTSHTQWELLTRLTAEWQGDDGRTLFLVGDPMQSIFGFREADVSLFLRAWRSGIGQVHLTPLRLTTNFRSDANVIEWNNDAFALAFPNRPDEVAGAVPLTASVAARPRAGGTAVEVHPFVQFPNAPRDDEAEAALVLQLIREARAANPDGSIAVLCRARTHVPALAHALRSSGLPYHAVEMDSLRDSIVVQDLMSLTRALHHPADRIAWLAILRAPWCGLTLADLLAITSDGAYATVWELLHRPGTLERVSEDGRARLARFEAVIATALARRARLPLRLWIESTWTALGGPSCLGSAAELADAEAFLCVLEASDRAGVVENFAVLERRIAKLYSQPDPDADGKVQLLTMHKAKGLEFDTVIVPGLGRTTSSDEDRLLNWLEHGERLLLAPIRAANGENDSLGDFVTSFVNRRADYEDARLLYVSATRTRHRLHLIGHVRATEKDGFFDLGKPQGLLAHVWPAVGEHFIHKLRKEVNARKMLAEAEQLPAPAQRTLRRLPSGWISPVSFTTVSISAPQDGGAGFLWTGDTLRHAGTVVHATLERIAGDGLNSWEVARVDALRGRWRAQLQRLGVSAADLEDTVGRVHRAVRDTLGDPRGRWILDNHSEARMEFALSAVLDGDIEHLKIDRTFVDAEGTRWIIDYKTAAAPAGEDVESFLDRECDMYRDQLRKYAAALALIDTRPIRIGLYFPLLSGWREWAFQETRATGAV